MKKIKVYIIFVIFSLYSFFFLVDPLNWWPIDHPMGQCASDDTRASCTGRITFFWQTP